MVPESGGGGHSVLLHARPDQVRFIGRRARDATARPDVFLFWPKRPPVRSCVLENRHRLSAGRLAMSAISVSSALRGKRHGKGYLCRCPVPSHGQGHGDRHPSLSVADAPDGKLLVHCHGGCDPRDVLAVLRDRGLDGDHDRRRAVFAGPVRTIDLVDPEPDPRALALWDAANTAVGTLAERYLAYRGIRIPPAFDPVSGRRRSGPGAPGRGACDGRGG